MVAIVFGQSVIFPGGMLMSGEAENVDIAASSH